ncbi:MAG: protein translocase subunit SecD [Parcubacteria group bacterium CG23_combo_of_CG06-09_8_20_14_all_35_9]|nr:MAG: protein translocase subunit SecD [Parcubacteria group bacterium CG23_combo_of_CG06-09_8_20_14_all_35_9]
MGFFSKIFSSLFRPTPKGKIRWAFFGILVLAILTGLLDGPKYYNEGVDVLNLKMEKSRYLKVIKLPHFPYLPFHLGLDLQGGTHLIYEADLKEVEYKNCNEAMGGVRDVIERRVNMFGVSEPLVQVAEKDRLVVELAGVKDTAQAIKIIGEVPILEFKEENPPQELTEEQKKEIENYNREAEEKAKEILEKVLKSGDFAELAREHSDCPSKDKGGDLDWFSRGMMVPEFEKAAFALGKDEITQELVKTPFGYHIIKKTDERTIEKEGKETEEIRASHILVKTKSERDYLAPEAQETWKNTGLSGKHLKHSQVQFDPNTGSPEVGLEFNSKGQELFTEITERNVDKLVAIFLDGYPISIPRVNEPIRGGKAVITGDFNLKEAKLLAQRLNAGALPVPIKLISQQTVGASLGKESVEKSLAAGVIGLIAVLLFMILYYRLPGLMADLSLIIYGLIVLALFKLVPVTLTLAGIAGFILSIGMAVDANVLIFERLKEELRRGLPLSSAIQEGFWRAWPSIRDGNISTLITCVILYWFSTGMIKGFALTLSVGIFVSMFSAIVITKVFLKGVATPKTSRWIWLWGIRKVD